MGHHISAALLKGEFDQNKAREFDLNPIQLSKSITMFPLEANYCDFWSEKLNIFGSPSEHTYPLLNSNVVHHMMNTIASTPTFAIIETDYSGGVGDQAAAVYQGKEILMSPQRNKKKVINQAIKKLGVRVPFFLRLFFVDEFQFLKLDQYRIFDEMFDKYTT
ncbi:MAG TPA: hypothetical protein PKC21_02610 [Oligoflexia bacterium]|nr:hypothetical protein [Oligoflexia bacterium]HMR24223.1 hypothetical protein [Oligoflexia bacterium]